MTALAGRAVLGLRSGGPGAVIAIRLAVAAGLIAIWEALVTAFAHDSSFFAAPSRILTDGLAVFGESDVIAALSTTAQRFGIAFAITAVAGVLLGLGLGRMERTAAISRNMLIVLYSVPQVAFYPLLMVWFGLGARSEVAFGVSHGLIAVILGTMAAAQQVDSELLEAAAAMGGGRSARLFKVILPASLPQVVGALRIGAGLCLLGVLLAEVLVSVDGVGAVINQLAGTLQPARLDALLLGVSLAAIAVNMVVGRIERGLSHAWRTD